MDNGQDDLGWYSILAVAIPLVFLSIFAVKPILGFFLWLVS